MKIYLLNCCENVISITFNISIQLVILSSSANFTVSMRIFPRRKHFGGINRCTLQYNNGCD